MQEVVVGNIPIGKLGQLPLICGPCAMESEDLVLSSAEFLKKLCDGLGIPLIFKSSYDKANRSSKDGFRGPGLEKGLSILEKVKKEFNLPVLTDVHSPKEALSAGQVCDVLQIPAFLCRQTDLILACGNTKAAINVKKGQFMAPQDVKHIIQKIESTGNRKIILTERGFCFGYNNLVSDFRSIAIMQSFGYPVCFDATHSTQLPGKNGASSGGESQFVPLLTKAAVAVGTNCLFIEAHPDPKSAKSDAKTQISFANLPRLLTQIMRIHRATYENALDQQEGACV